ncbi:GNAT family N-acetyltransferase [Actinoplanes derwentensis]|uniref:N-acetylglutamate synthase, GNAT family n=1 Tax=Actinoplanes derwentensis TaxID=113562 RepID=A0A1H2CYX8_9ACTN|nr:GNAT family N-acetyltransferase [Actinoplanes derwentensis]GID82978.1 phosphinothricin acetyltransferase [Actinoplanes derwentensis]SDT75631.1 N-acetylglutamate synthase, GNAT family [Actinoplanes derwentensis]
MTVVTTFRIRPARPDDAEAVVALRALVYPYLVRSEESTRRQIAVPSPGEDRAGLVAETAGEVVGWVAALRDPRSEDREFGRISQCHVNPAYRGRGIGTALLAEAAAHLRTIGVRRAGSLITPDAIGFAERRGFQASSRVMRFSARELRNPPCVPPRQDGIELCSVRDVAEAALYRAELEATGDVPEEVPSGPSSYDTWRHEIWDEPGLDRDSSTVALAGAQVVAFTLLMRDGERVWSDMTATVGDHRGRGLALMVKVAALRRAAAGGVTVAYASNAGENAPMLAVNTRLGYQPIATKAFCSTVL